MRIFGQRARGERAAGQALLRAAMGDARLAELALIEASREACGRPPEFRAVMDKLTALSHVAGGDIRTIEAALARASAAHGRWPAFSAVLGHARALRGASAP